MIKETLQAMAAPATMADLARTLGISPADLQARLSILEQSGYIERMKQDDSCSPIVCMGCSRKSSCAPKASGAAYSMTEKGRRAAGLD